MIGRVLLAMLALVATGAVAQGGPTQPDPARTVLVMLDAPPDHYRPGAGYGGGYGDTPARAAMLRVARHVARRHNMTLVDDWPMPAIGLECVVMTVTDARSTEAAAREISGDAGVAWAQPLQTYRTQGAQRGDPLLPAQPATRLWHLDALHGIATGRGVTVAVIDSRIDAHHPDLAGQVVLQQDMIGGHGDGPERHGTAVAGIVAARSGNGIGIAGVAPAARLMGLRACWQTGNGGAATCDSFSLAKALHVAIERRAGVINLSLTGPTDRLLDRLVRAAITGGATVVVAADRALPDGGFPASVPGVIGVTDQPAPPGTPLYGAPGRDIPAPIPGDGIALVDGSSFAAAHVSGLMALVRSRSDDIHVRPIRTASGGIDACRTLACAPPRRALACATGC